MYDSVHPAHEPTQAEIAWMAGIIEGEGYIRASVQDGTKHHTSIHLHMCDEDVVRRFARLAGVGTFRKGPIPASSKHKQSWRWSVCSKPDVEYLLQKLLPWLGKRRTQRAQEALQMIADRRSALGGRLNANGRHGPLQKV